MEKSRDTFKGYIFTFIEGIIKVFDTTDNVTYYKDNYKTEFIDAISNVFKAATLGDALKLMKDKIYPAMKGAFEKLYGYTSDANGIGEGNSTFEEAKYMLISCSAFVNYLKENYEEEK